MSSNTPDDAPDWWDDVNEATADDLLVDRDTKREYFRYNGSGYWVEYQELSWKQREGFVSDNLRITDTGAELDTEEYYADVLEAMIVDTSLDEGIATLIAGVESGPGDQLKALAPKPFGNLSRGAEGNSDDSSAEAT